MDFAVETLDFTVETLDFTVKTLDFTVETLDFTVNGFHEAQYFVRVRLMRLRIVFSVVLKVMSKIVYFMHI